MRYKNDSIFNFFVLLLFLNIRVFSNDFYDSEIKINSFNKNNNNYYLNSNFFNEKMKEEENITKFVKICKDLFPEEEPAAAVLIVKDEKILFENYYGLTNLSNGTKTNMFTNFNIASISKQFTAVGILQLVARGNISLEEPLKKYFPEYINPLWDKINLKHLLSHSSGIPDARGYLNKSKKIYGDENLALEYLTNLTELHFEPGSNYEYVNPTYVLIGRLIERITNKSFVDYIQENIFTPANMTNTNYIFQEKNACHAYEYEREEGDSEESSGDRPPGPHDWHEYDYGEETFFATRPDGGIYSNPRDFLKWEKALPVLLNQELLNEVYKPQIKVYGSQWSDYQNRYGTYYGYGWFIEPEKKCIYHTGDNGGFKILAAKYPDKNAFVLVFAARADWDRYALKIKIEEIFDLVPKNSEKIIFLLQMQIVNKKLKIFSVVNFNISKDEKFIFTIDTYVINSERLFQNELKEIEFYSLEDYSGNDDKIVEFYSNEEIGENIGAILQGLKNGNYLKTKSNENNNNLDTEKVKEEITKGGIDYNNIPLNHKIYQYSVISSNEGCEFLLNISGSIEINNTKNINLSFVDAENNNDKINAECTLSKDNKNQISCKLSNEVDKKYILEPFIFSDTTETITIFQKSNENYLPLKCIVNNNSQNDEDSSGGLSGGEVLGIILGILEAIIITLIYFLLLRKKKKDEYNDFLLNKEANI